MKTADGRDVYGVSGGPIEGFRESWAILPLVGNKPHYWRRIDLSNRFISLCGLKGELATREQLVARGMPHAQSIKPLSPGVFMEACCGNCQKKRQRKRRW